MDLGLVILLLFVQIPGYLFAHNRHMALRRCYEYAVARAEERDILDPEAMAYSDMATVITLDGKCSPRTPHPDTYSRDRF